MGKKSSKGIWLELLVVLANLYQALIGEGFSWDNQTFARVKIENDMVKIWVIFNSIDIWDRLDNKAH